jgi:hypothetical protein
MISRRRVAMWAATGGLVVTGLVMAATPILSGTALAADPTATPTTKSEVRGRDGAGVDTYLAQALGITTDQLTAARETARLAAIDQALAKGLITQAQADALKNNDRSFGRGGLGFFADQSQIDENALLAQALGITTDKLAQARTAAEDLRLAAAVADGTMTQAQADLMKAEQKLQTYMTEKNVYANAVNQAVKDGVITQAQADAILAQGKGGFGGRGGFGEFGGFGGHGGGGRGGHGAPSAAPSGTGA